MTKGQYWLVLYTFIVVVGQLTILYHLRQAIDSVLACNTNYHHNFSVKDGLHTYYDGIPGTIQVGEHQFVERRVIELWISMMLLSCSAVVFLRNLQY